MAGKRNQKNAYKEKGTESAPVKKRTRKASPSKAKKQTGLYKKIKSERNRKILGLFLVLLASFFLIAFISFLFTWRIDQDKLTDSLFEFLFSTPGLRVENWLGKFGAFTSHKFIHSWFGITAFIVVFNLYVLGFLALFKIAIFPIGKTLWYSLFFIVWGSLALGYFFDGEMYFLGGTLGYQSNIWLKGALGEVGTGLFLLFSIGIFVVIVFNPTYPSWAKISIGKLFESKPKPIKASKTDVLKDDDGFEDVKTPKFDPVPLPPEPQKEENNNDLSLTIDNPTEVVDIKSNSEIDANELAPETGVGLNPKILDLGIESNSNQEKEPIESREMSIEVAVGEEEELTEKEIDRKLKEFGEYDPTLDLSSYKVPPTDLLENYGSSEINIDKNELESNKVKIVETLKHYSIEISKIKATIGPTVTLYEIVPAPGVRISKIKNLEDDIALSLAALGIRIIAPIPGRGTIGIEVPNSNPDTVAMKNVLLSERFQNTKMALPIALGKTISNETFVADLAKMPHLLMAGATGQGKSVGLNAILVSLLYKKHPSQVKFVLVDPKKVELTLFNRIERHFLAKLPDTEDAIITDTKKVVHTLNSLCIEMDARYELLKDAHVRNIIEYNKKFVSRRLNPEQGHKFMPYIVLVVDEFADLIMTAGKEIEQPIARLAQLARAIGIHLIIATQRPSVNIITGTIKANFPARIAFRVTSKIDSRTILDAGGADQLIGRGDMLLSTGSDLIRLQCAFVDTPEVELITSFIGDQRGYPNAFVLPEYEEDIEGGGKKVEMDERDAKFEDAARLVVLHQQGSASLLQRKLKLGYNRAGRIVDQLEAAGIIGPFEGSKARRVLYPDEYSLEQFLNEQNSTDSGV